MRSTAALAACAIAASVPARSQDLQRLDATRERPLFSPTRRPPPPSPPVLAPVASASVLSSSPNLQVSGIVVGADRSIAILRRPSDPRPVSLEVGGEIDGWVVAAIHPREIDLQRGARSVTMRLTTH